MEAYEEEDTMPMFGEELEILLLEPCNGGNIGDIIKVHRGMYNTLIDIKKGIPVNDYGNSDALTNVQRLTINAKNLEEDNQELWEETKKLHKKVKELEAKVLAYETKKTKTKKKVTTPRKNKTT